ncbi:MAG: hypothetical protein WEB85_00685 [Dongiaceae bacterium]
MRRVLRRTYPGSFTLASATNPFKYDGAGRLKIVPTLVTDTTYDASGRVATLTRQNGVVTTYAYSLPRGWLTDLDTVKGTAVIQDLAYGRDAAGRIAGVTSPLAGESWAYGYDDLSGNLAQDSLGFREAIAEGDSVGNTRVAAP